MTPGSVLGIAIVALALAFSARTLWRTAKVWADALRGGDPCATCPLRQSCPRAGGGCSPFGTSFDLSLPPAGGNPPKSPRTFGKP
ncbi:hypothetical protein [Brockia lithotrophica]|uniref:Uncharacterized protein n=1 Tax=Brockia lithotrophica TaxID=933949 RepID=A0A660LAC8_9BACL|nr:hypothetical protein [Brockia lithotrophica]RKQ88923.1 hypothetical protein C7438_0576 [Brockia lithotrophica]